MWKLIAALMLAALLGNVDGEENNTIADAVDAAEVPIADAVDAVDAVKGLGA